MHSLIGFANTGIHEVALKLKSVSYRVITPGDDRWKKAPVVLVPGVACFLANEEDLLKSLQVVIVFDSPVRLDGLLGIEFQDVGVRRDSFTYDFIKPDWPRFRDAVLGKVSDAEDGGEPLEFGGRRSPNILPVLLNSTSASVMAGFQTFFYSVKETVLRDELRSIFIRWFFAGSKVTVGMLGARYKKKLSEKSHAAIDTLLENTPLEKLRAAVVEASAARTAGKTVTTSKLDAAMKGTGLSAFDVRYIISAYDKMNKTQYPENLSLRDLRLSAAAGVIEEEVDPDVAAAEAEAECLRS